jgi:hypothetical protein
MFPLQIEGVNTKEDVSRYTSEFTACVYTAKTNCRDSTIRCI